jgi:ADP-heptose:LPS heptosyltransferase
LEENGIGERLIVLHPGSGGSAEPWPLDKFIKLYEELSSNGYDVVFTGSEEEGVLINKDAKKYGIKVRTITGETDLRTLAALLSLATVVVANSTGPLHLAAAVNTNVVGLYPSKKIMSPVRWGPLGCNSRIVQPAAAVCNCPSSGCNCMESITIVQVAAETAALFEMEEAKTGSV